MDFPIPAPFINGHLWSHASIEIRIGVMPVLVDCQEISYSAPAEVGDVWGTRPQKIGTTRGQSNPQASIRMLTRSWERLRNLLVPGGIGYGEIKFPIVVQYGEIGTPVKTDILEGCRITDVQYTSSVGTDANSVTLPLNVMRLFEGVTGTMYLPIGIAL